MVWKGAAPRPFPTCLSSEPAGGLRSGPHIPRAQLEGERDKACPEERRIGADPPAPHNGAEPRRRDQHDSENNRNDPAERHPPAAMVLFEIIGRAELQRPRDKGPSR